MERPFQAYEGDQSYVFVCYSHDDREFVYPEIDRLRETGLNIWYDEGIAPGSEWSEMLAQHIDDCALFLYLVTPQSVASEHCRHEVNYALEEKRPILAVHLTQTDVPRGLRLSLNTRQAILKYEYPKDLYEAKLARAIHGGLANDFDDPRGPSTLRLGEWTLDVGAQRLTRGGESHTLDPKAQSVLLHLVDRAPEIVSREGLLAHSWRGVVVGENVLDQAISQLRHALGDDARDPKYIETLPRRGYRLMAGVANEGVGGQLIGTQRRSLLRWTIAAAAVVVFTVGAWLVGTMPFEQASPGVTIVVEPFTNRSADENLTYLAQGLRDELVHQLARIPTLAVHQFDDGDGNANGYRVSGSLAPDGAEGLAISLQLSRSGRTVWSQNYSAPSSDRVRNRLAVAQRATESISTIVWFETQSSPRWDATDDNARLAVLRGITLLGGGRNWGTQDSAQAYFDQAIRLDPEFTLAYAWKALTYLGAINAYVGGIEPREGFAEVRALVQRALEIDPDDVWALAISVDVKRYDGDWELAEDTVQRILELTPTPPPTVAEHLAYCGRFDEALRIMDRLILANPVSGGNRNIKAHVLWLARRDAEAEAVLDDILAAQPDNPRANQLLSGLLESAGKFPEATRAFGLFPANADSREEFGSAWIQIAEATEQQETTTLPAKAWRYYVMGYTRLGEYREAVTWLEKGWGLGDQLEFWAMRSYAYPGFDEMRATPEYQDLIERTIGRPPTCPGYTQF